MTRRMSKARSIKGYLSTNDKKAMKALFGSYSINDNSSFFEEEEKDAIQSFALKHKFYRIDGLYRKNSKRFKQLFT